MWSCDFQGIWSGMLCGTIVQTSVLFFMMYKTNWNREVSLRSST